MTGPQFLGSLEDALGIYYLVGTLREKIAADLGVYASKDDVVAIERGVRAAVIAVLPDGAWLHDDLLYTDPDDPDDLDDLLAEIGSQVDIAAITETYQQELTPIEIHDESVEDLHTACLGPRYSDAYEEADQGGDTATCARLEREQAQFAERLYEAWAVEVVRIGAEHGYEVKPVDGNDSVFPPQSRTESSGFTQGRTVEDFIHDAAHDAVAIDDL